MYTVLAAVRVGALVTVALAGVCLGDTEIPLDGYRSGDGFVSFYVARLNANKGAEQVTVIPEPGIGTFLALGSWLLLPRRPSLKR